MPFSQFNRNNSNDNNNNNYNSNSINSNNNSWFCCNKNTENKEALNNIKVDHFERKVSISTFRLFDIEFLGIMTTTAATTTAINTNNSRLYCGLTIRLLLLQLWQTTTMTMMMMLIMMISRKDYQPDRPKAMMKLSSAMHTLLL